MTRRTKKNQQITRDELREPFRGELAKEFPPVLSPVQVGALLGISRSTVYAWVAAGRFDGAFRRRGKHLRFWRDRLLEAFFNGPSWGPQKG